MTPLSLSEEAEERAKRRPREGEKAKEEAKRRRTRI